MISRRKLSASFAILILCVGGPLFSQTPSDTINTSPAASSQNIQSAPALQPECFPPCRSGFTCVNSQCVTACNPPCPPGTICKSGDCVPIESHVTAAATSESKQKKQGTHEGLCFFFNLGAGAGIINTSFPYQGKKTSLMFISPGPSFSLGAGYSFFKNTPFFLHVSGNGNFGAQPQINGKPSGFDSTDLMAVNFGAGATHYFSRNRFVGATLGMNWINIADTSEQSFNSGKGVGLGLKCGKEWWVSSKWALGIGLSYYSSMQTGGNIVPSNSLLFGNGLDIFFTVTFD